MRQFIFLFTVLLMSIDSLRANEKVVLLHGLCRTPASMKKLEHNLILSGYEVTNLGYPSRKFTIEDLSKQVRSSIIMESNGFGKIHIVTHSMGGIIIRYIQKSDPIPNIGRVVMLSPPNGGSEIVDRLGNWFIYKWINGPAGSQMGTAKDSLVSAMGPVDFELGIITGNRSINLILSTMIPGKDDGKVSVERAKVEGMKAFKVVPKSHPFIMKDKNVINDILSFLENGEFKKKS